MKLKDLKLKSVGYLINLGIRMLYNDHHGFVFNANCGVGLKRSLSAGRTESIASKTA